MAETVVLPEWIAPGKRVAVSRWANGRIAVSVESVAKVLKTKVVTLADDGTETSIPIRTVYAQGDTFKFVVSKANAFRSESVNLIRPGSVDHLTAMSYRVDDVASRAQYRFSQNRSDPSAIEQAADMLAEMATELRSLAAEQRRWIAAPFTAAQRIAAERIAD